MEDTGVEPLQTTQRNEVVIWSHNYTLSLIDLYKLLRKKVGSFEIRSMKRFWEVLASKINKLHGTNFLPANCENRWRVIERNYKKYVDDSQKTGRGRKVFEYANEMDEIFREKRNINPELLLSSDTTDHLPRERQEHNYSSNGNNTIEQVSSGQNSELQTEVELTNPSTSKNTFPIRKKSVVQKSSHLEMMRKDKKEYYAQLLKIHRERVEFERTKFEEKMSLERRKLEVKDAANEAFKERNNILKQYLKYKVDIPNFLFDRFDAEH